MLFNSLVFIILLITTMVIYYIPRMAKFQVPVLILSSLVFYSWHNIALVVLLLISAGINIVSSFLIANNITSRRKLVAWVGVSSNLLVLAFFKYAGLISLTFFRDGSISEFLITIPLPIGISFFTFQGISLVLDVHTQNHFRNDKIISTSFIDHAQKTLFFIAFFPQLVAGPIVKAHEFLPQIKTKRFPDINWETAFREIVLGYFLKMVVADNIKDFTFWISFPYFQGKDTVSLLTMLFGYSCQIYADFAGYSLIAIGVARLFGYNLKANFNYPYISSSFREFWKRWHISLSSWLMEYLYFSLGGNRKGKARTYINLMITMILGGLWHGAAWSYAVWGAFHGIALALERMLVHNVRLKETRVIRFIKMVFVFSMVTLAWLLFKLPEFSHVTEYVKTLFINTNMSVDIPLVTRIFFYSSPVVLHHLYYMYNRTHVGNQKYRKFEFLLYGCMIFLILSNSGIPGAFIYFQF
ncbi:MAG: MBOAT family O-acyltransferase [Bacteroidota bacterium]